MTFRDRVLWSHSCISLHPNCSCAHTSRAHMHLLSQCCAAAAPRSPGPAPVKVCSDGQTSEPALLVGLKWTHTQWILRPDTEACGEWNANPLKLDIVSYGLQTHKTNVSFPSPLSLHTYTHMSPLASPTTPHTSTGKVDESFLRVLSIISIPWKRPWQCSTNCVTWRVSGVKWNAHSKCHFVFEA